MNKCVVCQLLTLAVLNVTVTGYCCVRVVVIISSYKLWNIADISVLCGPHDLLYEIISCPPIHNSI